MNNVINNVPYLRTSRNFPAEIKQLTVEVDRSYVDIANAVNFRTIGIFPTSRPIQTGDSYFLNQNQRQQSFRQVYTVGAISTGGTATIKHNISTIIQFAKIYGTVITAVPDYRPLPFADASSVNNQMSIRCDATNIYIVLGSAAPAVTSGLVILEWISAP